MYYILFESGVSWIVEWPIIGSHVQERRDATFADSAAGDQRAVCYIT